MACELHDEYAVDAQFVTHLIGRVLGAQGLKRTPVDTAGFRAAQQVSDDVTHTDLSSTNHSK